MPGRERWALDSKTRAQIRLERWPMHVRMAGHSFRLTRPNAQPRPRHFWAVLIRYGPGSVQVTRGAKPHPQLRSPGSAALRRARRCVVTGTFEQVKDALAQLSPVRHPDHEVASREDVGAFVVKHALDDFQHA